MFIPCMTFRTLVRHDHNLIGLQRLYHQNSIYRKEQLPRTAVKFSKNLQTIRNISTMAPTQNLPMLYVRAKSHYDVGVVIGKTFKGWIQDYMKISKGVQIFRDFYATNEGRVITKRYLETSKKSHPDIISEVQGMADGCEVSFDELFLLQVASEIIFCHAEEVLKKPPPPVQSDEAKSCTDVLLNRANMRILGHNDDWGKDLVDHVYMVHVTITDDKDKIVEQFISYNYPGYLNGFCFGMNSSLVISVNSLTPKKANTDGVSLSVLLRSLLACSTIKECVAVMENKPHGCAYGMCINVASIQDTEMASLEVYPNQGKTEVHVHNIPHESQTDISYYCHQNFYKHIKAVETDGCRGARLRDKRASELFPVKDMDDVRAILGDTKEECEPIYRKITPQTWSQTAETNSTAIFDITNRKLHVYRSNPKLAHSAVLSLPFL